MRRTLSASNRATMNEYAQKGMLLDLTPYADQLEGVKSLVGEDALTKGMIGDTLYAIPRTPDPLYHTYWIRTDWLENLGLEMPTTLDELRAVLVAFREQDPDGNGAKDTYGLTGQSLATFAPIFGAFGVTAPASAWGTGSADALYLEDGQLVNSLGARTLLVEKNGMLGGTTTVAGVNFPGLFHAWGRQIIGGIGWELVCRAAELSGHALPDFTDFRRPHWLLQVRVNTAIYAALADEAVLAAGVEILFHTMVADVVRPHAGAPDSPATAADRWRLTLCCKEGLRTVTGRVLLDCTGDANVVGLAGYARKQNTELQPGTIRILLGGYDVEELGMGQAAGALAALACRRNCDVEDVPIPELYDLLAEYGAIVPGSVR